MFKSIVFLIAILFVSYSYSQNRLITDSIDNLLTNYSKQEKLKELKKIYMNKDLSPSITLNYAFLADSLSSKLNNINEELIASIYIALSYRNMANYIESLSFFEKTLNLSKTYKNDSIIGEVYYLIGTLHSELGHNKKCIENFNQALIYLKKVNHITAIGNTYSALGNYYDKIGNDSLALLYINKAIPILENKPSLIIYPLNTIGLIYSKNKEYNKAIKYYKKASRIAIDHKHYEAASGIISNMAITYAEKNNMIKAKQFFIKSLEFAKKTQNPNIISMIYNYLSEFYYKTKLYKLAYEYHLKYTNIKDSLFTIDKQNQYIEMQEKYDVLKKEQEIVSKNKKIRELEYNKLLESIKLKYYLSLFGLLIILVIIVVLKLRKKVKDSKLIIIKNNKIIEIQKKINELEKNKLNNELKYKAETLTGFALDISRKNELIKDVNNTLKKHKKSSSKEVKEIANELFHKVNQQYLINEELKHFQDNVDEVNQKFFAKLEKKYPELTMNEKKTCGLIRIGLNSKDIASLYNISVKSVEMNRYRIRKKIGLPTNHGLSNFLQNI